MPTAEELARGPIKGWDTPNPAFASYTLSDADVTRLHDLQARAEANRQLLGPDVAALIQRYRQQYGPDADVMAARDRLDKPHDPDLRNAEHALFTQKLVDQYGPLGAAIVAASVPAYSGLKGAVQALPPSVGQAIDRISPVKLYGATAPSLDEVRWGLSPLLGQPSK